MAFEESIKALRELDEAREQAIKAIRSSAREQIRDIERKSGLSLEELFPERMGGGARPAAAVTGGRVGKEKKIKAPIYQHPQTGAQWSGQGHSPAWYGSERDRGGVAAVEAMLIPGQQHSLGVSRWLEEARAKEAGKTRKALGKALPAAAKKAPAKQPGRTAKGTKVL
ncbi:H-NS histone family protein [Xanthomonas sp. NCPPB 2632]|uniref:H-NS histone family protein n=1 Tax=Xanthomonas sp. NCPPB 2632 TaxID=3240912 RepID=UPI00351991E2